MIKEYADNYDTMTDAQAQDYIKRANDIDEQLLALRMKYVPIFEKVCLGQENCLVVPDRSSYRLADQFAVFNGDTDG